MSNTTIYPPALPGSEGGSADAVWGGISGSLSDQSDLNLALTNLSTAIAAAATAASNAASAAATANTAASNAATAAGNAIPKTATDAEAAYTFKGTMSNSVGEISPIMHPGLVADRFYSSPHFYVGAAGAVAGTAYFVMVHVPHRTTLKKLGINTNTAATNAKAVLGIYTAKNGVPATRVYQSAEFDISAVGDHEVTLSQRLDAGTYFLSLVTSVTTTIAFHSPGVGDVRVALLGQSSSTLSGSACARVVNATLAYSATPFPATWSGALTYGAQDNEPHIWFRV